MQELFPQVKNTRHKILVVNPRSLGILIFLDLGLGRAWDFGLSIMQRMAQKSESILHHFFSSPEFTVQNLLFLHTFTVCSVNEVFKKLSMTKTDLGLL